jgi:hypothetical protein
MAPETDNNDAGQSKAEDAIENDVSEIVSTKDEKRSFAPVKDADSQPQEADKHVDKQLDHGLKETFPASDPVSINPGAD